MATISDAQAVQLLETVGFPAVAARVMSSISWAESRRTLEATNHNSNGSQDSGWLQINSVHFGMRLPGGVVLSQANVFDPQINAQAAYQIWKDAGGSFTPWSTFNSGAYKGAQDTASTIPDTSHIGGRGMSAPTGGGPSSWWAAVRAGLVPGIKAGIGGTPLAGIPAAVSDGQKVVGAAQGAISNAEAVAGFLSKLSDRKLWEKVGLVALGVTILILGIILFAGPSAGKLAAKMPIPVPV